MRDLNSSASKIQLGNLSLKLTGYTIFVAHPMEHFMFYRLMEGEFRGWLIPSSSLSSAVGNFQRISSLLVGPLVCRKRRSFSSIVKLAQVAFSVSIALDCFRSIGRFFVTHSERLFNPTGRGRGKILVAHLGERPCRGRNSKVLISRFDPGVK